MEESDTLGGASSGAIVSRKGFATKGLEETGGLVENSAEFCEKGRLEPEEEEWENDEEREVAEEEGEE